MARATSRSDAVTSMMVVVLSIAAAVGISIKPAWSHDPYSDWVAPDNPGLSCCHGADCRPTRAFMANDGLWRAWNGRMWLPVPPGRVLPTDYAGDGRSHLCEKLEVIYCFTPSEPKG